MRRKDKEITEIERITQILNTALFCHVAMSDDDTPYCVPMCFVHHNGTILLHSACEGKKIEILSKNPRVCITIEQGCELISSKNPCDYGMAYESVMIEGVSTLLIGQRKSEALGIIASKYAGTSGGQYPEESIAHIAVIEVTIKRYSGRRSGSVPS